MAEAHNHDHETAWIESRAGREFQMLVLDRVAWLQWVTLGPKTATRRASAEREQRKSIWKDVRKWAFGLFDRLRERPEPREERPDDPEEYDSWLSRYLEQDWNPVYEEIGRSGTFPVICPAI